MAEARLFISSTTTASAQRILSISFRLCQPCRSGRETFPGSPTLQDPKPDNRWSCSIRPPTPLTRATSFRDSVHKLVPRTGPSSGVAGLLQYIPCPNLPGNFQNFHYVTSANSDSDDLNVRLNRTFGAAPAGGRRGGGRNAPRNNLHLWLSLPRIERQPDESVPERRRQHVGTQL